MNSWDDLREAIVVRRGQTPSPEGDDGCLHAVWAVADHVVCRSRRDVMKRIAAPMIGGIITSFLMELIDLSADLRNLEMELRGEAETETTGPRDLEPANIGGAGTCLGGLSNSECRSCCL